jgi:hypothetical protein
MNGFMFKLQINFIKVLRKDPVREAPVRAIQDNSFGDIPVILGIND